MSISWRGILAQPTLYETSDTFTPLRTSCVVMQEGLVAAQLRHDKHPRGVPTSIVVFVDRQSSGCMLSVASQYHKQRIFRD